MEVDDTDMVAWDTNDDLDMHRSEDNEGASLDNQRCPLCEGLIGHEYVRCDWECKTLYHLSCVGLKTPPTKTWCCKTCLADVPHWKGPISWIPVGSTFKKLEDCAQDYLHRSPQSGIHGHTIVGVFSIVLTGRHNGDDDNGEVFKFTGQNGRGFLPSIGQSFTGNNLALARSCAAPINPEGAEPRNWRQGNPIRVIRWIEYLHQYRYEGIYKITRYWREMGEQGYMVYKYEFERDDDAPPLPYNAGKDIDEEEWKAWE
ncbi:hypothetical protein B7494_g4606 [Chlorociboria aeruginascens]|nr:hypothetical protein B7494_g4606 [Chlorociboria aeruginascens]